jgi:hypothetical protein
MSSGTERRTRSRLHLRAFSRSGSVQTVFDPIGAVCHARTGEIYEPGSWADAGELLGMVPTDAAAVIAASNDRTWTGPDGGREPAPTLRAMRIRMMEAAGLEPADA